MIWTVLDVLSRYHETGSKCGLVNLSLRGIEEL